MSDPISCERINNRVKALETKLESKINDIWKVRHEDKKSLEKVEKLLKGEDLEGGVVGAIIELKGKVGQIKWIGLSILTVLIGQLMTTYFK